MIAMYWPRDSFMLKLITLAGISWEFYEEDELPGQNQKALCTAFVGTRLFILNQARFTGLEIADTVDWPRDNL